MSDHKRSFADFLLKDGPVLDEVTMAAINARNRPVGAFLGIDHVQITVPVGGEESCRTFYLDVLGLAEIKRPDASEGRSFLWARVGLQELHFRTDPDFSPARFAHPGFAVLDAAALADYLERVGWEVSRNDASKAGRFHIRDPFGNRLELVDVTTGR